MAKKSLPTTEMSDASDDFEALYQSNEPLVYRFMFWRTKDEMLAEDLTSNVFEKAWRTRKSFTGGSAKAWLFRIARTTLIDHWRKIKDVPDDGSAAAEIVADLPEPGEAFDQKIALAELRKSITQLPPDMMHVVELRFIEGLSARQTAHRLQISEANVRVIQYRALQKLRQYLQ